jgi:uncharacterized protein (DUF4415 family)
MNKRDDDRVSQSDEDNPEWTREDFAKARPARQVFAEVFGPAAAESIARRRGRPPKIDKKINQTLRLDADVLDAYRRQGPGWQTRINQVLRAQMPERCK